MCMLNLAGLFPQVNKHLIGLPVCLIPPTSLYFKTITNYRLMLTFFSPSHSPLPCQFCSTSNLNVRKPKCLFSTKYHSVWSYLPWHDFGVRMHTHARVSDVPTWWHLCSCTVHKEMYFCLNPLMSSQQDLFVSHGLFWFVWSYLQLCAHTFGQSVSTTARGFLIETSRLHCLASYRGNSGFSTSSSHLTTWLIKV